MQTSKPGRVTRTIAPLTWALCMLTPAVLAQQTQPTPVPQADTCRLDPDRTAHITRVVPVPGRATPPQSAAGLCDAASPQTVGRRGDSLIRVLAKRKRD